ncbi:hypothetical protein BC939DRAFT_508893 [Gamsiella multidivaricata]|uniref:uncharacterized protein n=1 Tax=Gamsiella multidivaricata TaxID=101098 RepID=UPI00221E6EE0|nr:uncharacterized protein BC939DRAFT_508893 [Gamsiella multidivaricata]KAI7815826.1 hypothetical protein BC939DRAFT_508893 [Gamsiella multidivaricata]
MDASNQKAIVAEWNGWMATFLGSKHRVLVGLARKQHKLAQAVSKCLLNKVLVGRKLDMMETSKAQLRDNETEMTHMLRNAGESSSAPLSLSLNRKRKRPMQRRGQPSVPMDEQDATSPTADKASPSHLTANEDAQAPTLWDPPEPAATAASTSGQVTPLPVVSSSSSTAVTIASTLGPATTPPEVSSSSSTEAAEEHVNVIDENERAELLAHIEQASHAILENRWHLRGVFFTKRLAWELWAIIGIFAPFLPTERMIATIGRTMLEELIVPMILPDLVLDDTAILTAVRLWINYRQEEASEALRELDRQTRNMIETLFERLPMKQDRSISESTFVVNYVSPVLHETLKLDPRIYSVHFPNTCSEVQKHQGLKPDRPDIVVKARNREILYGEVTVGARGMYLLQEVGSFVIPTMVSMIPALLATLPTLLVAQNGSADKYTTHGKDANEDESHWPTTHLTKHVRYSPEHYHQYLCHPLGYQDSVKHRLEDLTARAQYLLQRSIDGRRQCSLQNWQRHYGHHPQH